MPDLLYRIGKQLPGLVIASLPILVDRLGKGAFERTVTDGVNFHGPIDKERVIKNVEFFTTSVALGVGLVTLAIAGVSAKRHNDISVITTVALICIATALFITILSQGTKAFFKGGALAKGAIWCGSALKVWELLVEWDLV